MGWQLGGSCFYPGHPFSYFSSPPPLPARLRHAPAPVRAAPPPQDLGQVLLGYYTIPSSINRPIESVINPQGLQLRALRRVWNRGDGRTKFMYLARHAVPTPDASGRSLDGLMASVFADLDEADLPPGPWSQQLTPTPADARGRT